MIRQRFPLILICLTSLVLFPFVTHSQIHISGDVSGTLVDTTYIVDDDIIVDNVLYINPGAELLFTEGTSLEVVGRLFALGEEGDSIYFTAYEDEDWNGLYFHDQWHDSDMQYCVISGSVESGIDLGSFGWLTLWHSSVHHNASAEGGSGIRVRFGGALDIKYCDISYNENNGLLIESEEGSNSDEFSYLTFRYNQESAIVLNFYVSSVLLRNCHFIGNESENEGAVIKADILSGGIDVRECSFVNNMSGGLGAIIYEERCNIGLYIYDSIITNNNSNNGAAIYLNELEEIVIHNSIITNNNNKAIYTEYDDILRYSIIMYTNFYNNETGIIGNDNNQYYTLEMTGTNYNNTPCNDHLCISQDPCFVDIENGDVHLAEGSPCIDAGDPRALDPDGTPSEMGCYYYDQAFVIEHEDYDQPASFMVSPAYPNPFNATTSVLVETPFRSPLTLRVYDILGRVVYSRNDNTADAGQHLLQVEADGWASGVYFLNVSNGNRQNTQRILYIK